MYANDGVFGDVSDAVSDSCTGACHGTGPPLPPWMSQNDVTITAAALCPPGCLCVSLRGVRGRCGVVSPCHGTSDSRHLLAGSRLARLTHGAARRAPLVGADEADAASTSRRPQMTLKACDPASGHRRRRWRELYLAGVPQWVRELCLRSISLEGPRPMSSAPREPGRKARCPTEPACRYGALRPWPGTAAGGTVPSARRGLPTRVIVTQVRRQERPVSGACGSPGCRRGLV